LLIRKWYGCQNGVIPSRMSAKGWLVRKSEFSLQTLISATLFIRLPLTTLHNEMTGDAESSKAKA
jgi:hypothetical protein